MDAKELRLGNIVYAGIDADENPLACVVKEIGKDYIKWGDRGGNTTYINSVDPIPITPEILVKAGFWKRGENYATYQLTISDEGEEYPTTLQIWPRSVNNYIQICRSGIGAWTVKNFEYVHQLQNLYYSLTGKELEINL